MLDFYTYKEIKQQPRMWVKACEQILDRKEEIASFVHKYLDRDWSASEVQILIEPEE